MARRITILTVSLGLLGACGDSGSEDTTGPTAPTSVTVTASATSSGGSTGDTGGPGSSSGEAPTTGETGAASTGDGPDTADDTTGPPDPTEPMTSTTSDDTTTGFVPEHFMLVDPLKGGTMGTPIGGSFSDQGWTVTDRPDRIFWAVPSLAEGSVEFTVTNVTLANLPLRDHEIFGMYEGGYDIEHPIKYNPEYRNNTYKSMIRIYGAMEVGREGQQKIMWGMCPSGAPGYLEGECPCVDPPPFFEEPFGGEPTWDGTPQRLRFEWGADKVTRYFRNGNEVLAIDWSQSGQVFGVEDLYVSLGTPRPIDVGDAGMPIGAVFYDVVIEGWTGPKPAMCQ